MCQNLVFQTGAQIGFNHPLVVLDLINCAFGQNLAFSHHDHRVTKLSYKIHVMFDHAECIAALFVQAHNRIANGIEQRAVNPGTIIKFSRTVIEANSWAI